MPPRPTVTLTAGGRTAPRWTLRATPTRVETARTQDDALDLLRTIAGHPTAPIRPAPTPTHASDAPCHTPDTPPFRSGWALAVSYDLGRHLEPAAAHPGRPTPDRDLPLVVAARIDHAELVSIEPVPTPTAPPITNPSADTPADTRAHDRAAYTTAVRRALDYIRAGDVYQVNLTRRFQHAFRGDHRALAAALFAAAQPAHGCTIEWPNAQGGLDALISASPELFLSYDPTTRTLRTRPMKGTRPAADDPAELHAAEKDRAELAMIVDLMRNDLTRVCTIPSVRIEEHRTVDTHARSVHQATATIAGTLRPDRTLADAISHTFPPGSVTGAPKIRAMQLIDQLEDAPRGFYCGLAGWIDDSGHAELSVTIRAAVVSGPAHARTVDIHAGAGIVADSDPDAEWGETLLKTEVVQAALASADIPAHTPGLEPATT